MVVLRRYAKHGGGCTPRLRRLGEEDDGATETAAAVQRAGVHREGKDRRGKEEKENGQKERKKDDKINLISCRFSI